MDIREGRIINGGVMLHLNLLRVLFFYVVLINIAGLAVMGVDKSKAKRHVWRIPEATLFLVSFLVGSIGTWAGMYLFRHKTKHWYFVVGMPLICVFHLGLVTYMFYRIFG